jgi:heme/copper-type cytochrome/quinol oxidase subunit 2
VVASATQAAPPPKSYSLLAPLALARTLTWPTLGTLAILLIVWLVYLITHLTVWRHRLKRWQNPTYRGVAAVQTGGVALLILYLATAGFGHVG